jgi:hypothetical protein
MNFKESQFSYNLATKTYVAEASDLRISSPGQYVTVDGYAFVFTHADKDISGEDIMGWRYAPTGNSLSINPALAGHGLLIIND